MTVESENEPLRLFVAIQVSAGVRKEIIRTQQELRECVPRDVVRWASPERFHLTLKFLGAVPADCVESLKKSVESTCTGIRALGLRALGIGFFPSARSPRVIWVGVRDQENRLAELQQNIEQVTRPFTSEQGGETFVGHLTLGRFKDGRRPKVEALVNRALTLRDRDFGGWTANEVELVRSELSPDGARHTVLGAFPLRGGQMV